MILLVQVVKHDVSAYSSTRLDQIAQEARHQKHNVRVRAPTGLLGDASYKSLTKYGDKSQTKKPFHIEPVKIRNYTKNETIKTLPYEQIQRQPPPYVHMVKTVSIQAQPDKNDSDDDYYGWVPIVPIFQRDDSGKTRQTRHNTPNPVQRSLRRSLNLKGRYLPVHLMRYSPYRRQSTNKIALKRYNYSAFSNDGGQKPVTGERDDDADPSDSHHVEYKTKIKHHHHHHHHKYIQKVVEKVPVKVPVKVYVPQPYPVEKKVPYPVEKIVHKVVEKKVHVPVEKKVPYPVEVKVPQPYPVKVIEKEYVLKPYPVVKHVPIIKHVEVKVPVPKPVPYPVEKKVPYPVNVHIPVPVEKLVPYPVEVEKRVPVKVFIPQPYPVEKKVPYPVEVKVKEPYPVFKHIPVPIKVFVDKPYPVPVPKPYAVHIEKKVPYPVEVEKKVPYPVKVYVPQPYPVEHHSPAHYGQDHVRSASELVILDEPNQRSDRF